jgi:putative hydrolase of the HAD superfamily
MRIKAVIFDLDNTLYDEKQFVRSGFRAVSNHMAEKYGMNREKLYDLLLSIFSKQGREKVFDIALKKLNLYKKEVVLEMVEVYRTHFPNITLNKDAQEVLPKLKKKYTIGLITDGIKKVQESKVEALNIKDLFDVITYAVEHGGKNNIQAFQVTLEKLEVKPSETICVDDNPLKGFVVAKKHGIHTVRILRGEHRDLKVNKHCKPEFEIKNLRQLFNVIF